MAAPAEGERALAISLVTAQKRAQSLQDVPAAVAAVQFRVLGERDITQFSQLAQLSPSLTLTVGAHTANNSIVLRAVGTSAFGTGSEPSVAIIADDPPAQRPLFGMNSSAGHQYRYPRAAGNLWRVCELDRDHRRSHCPGVPAHAGRAIGAPLEKVMNILVKLDWRHQSTTLYDILGNPVARRAPQGIMNLAVGVHTPESSCSVGSMPKTLLDRVYAATVTAPAGGNGGRSVQSLARH